MPDLMSTEEENAERTREQCPRSIASAYQPLLPSRSSTTDYDGQDTLMHEGDLNLYVPIYGPIDGLT